MCGGSLHDSIATKMSKSVDMRFNWIADRVRQKQFTAHHIPGVNNVADFFTKLLSVQHHQKLAPYHLSAHAYTSAKRKQSKSLNYQMTVMKPWTPTLALNILTDLDNRLRPIAWSCVCTAQTPLMPPKPMTPNPNPAIYYYCAYHGFNLSRHGHQCRVMSNDDT
jgi:hypothetical protein